MSRATVCRSWYSPMSMRTMARSSSNRNSASARASSVLPTPVGPRNKNVPIGRLASARPARLRLIGPDNRAHCFVLADHAAANHVLHLDQLGRLALYQPRHGHPGPRADDGGDLFGVYL